MKKTVLNKIKYLLLVFPLAIFLTSCGEGLGNDIASKLIPNIWAFLIQLIALIVLIIVVYFAAYKPISKFIQARKDLLENEVKETKAKNQEASDNLSKSIKKLANTKKEANAIIDNAILQANKESQKIIDEAHNEALETKTKALKDLEKAKQDAAKSLQKEIVDVAFDASSKILEREVDEKDNSKIVDDFIKGLDKGNH